MSFLLILFVQVEETTREREERLKGWSNFLEGENPGQQNTTKPAEGATSAEPREPPSTTGRPETDTQEQEVDSTDSSLAGSDEEEA